MDQYYQYRSINPLPIVPSYALVQHTSLSIGMRDEGGGALWNDSRTRAVKGGLTLGEKHATFTADFRAYRAISGDPYKY
jgi:hypothetical protein